MKINKLSLKNYRNIEEISLLPCDGVNIIYGENAQGKTNILEDLGLVQHLLHGKDGILGVFQNGVEATDNRHGQDNVAVFAASVDIAQAVVGNIPDEVDNLIVLVGVYGSSGTGIFLRPDYRKRRRQFKRGVRGKQ